MFGGLHKGLMISERCFNLGNSAKLNCWSKRVLRTRHSVVLMPEWPVLLKQGLSELVPQVIKSIRSWQSVSAILRFFHPINTYGSRQAKALRSG